MTELFVVFLIVLFALRLVLEAIAWGQRWHRGVLHLQEQARMRALAAQREQVAAYWAEFNRER